ncbi:hypothetical protein BDZ97DRAFT_1759354 [Flammula alnicola]|nr:hypothetical protein BDZ97DRAFT_1759354 [Flammula alnicola]
MSGATSTGAECVHFSTTSFGTSTRYSGLVVSTPSSPRSNALVLPSPPDSPGSPAPSIDSASESSLPSVSSSFFFSSSAAGSPGRSHPASYPSSHPHSDHDHEYDHDSEQNPHHTRVSEQGLIIPSLTLPDALRRPTPFGQTLGDLKVLVLGGQGAGKSFLTGLILEDNEDVVEVGTWEDWHGGEDAIDGAYAYGKSLKASTDWVEQHDVFGLERFEPTKNVEIVELPGYSHDADGTELIARLTAIIEAPFRSLHDVLHPDTDPSGVVANLLAAPTSPLYTALIFLIPSPPTALDQEIITTLSTHIPLIVLPRLQGPHRGIKSTSTLFHSAKLSTFRPASAVALRHGLFRSPETVSLLRSEAVDRFLKWREVERAVEGIWEGSQWDQSPRIGRNLKLGGARRGFSGRRVGRKLGEREWGRGKGESEGGAGDEKEKEAEGWSKAKWEAEWMESHSQDVAKRMREGTITQRSVQRSRTGTILNASEKDQTHDLGQNANSNEADLRSPQYRQGGYAHAPFDPLHLQSLLVFSVSLLGPLRTRLGESVQSVVEALGETRVRVALLGGFCVGLGVGVLVKSWRRPAGRRRRMPNHDTATTSLRWCVAHLRPTWPCLHITIRGRASRQTRNKDCDIWSIFFDLSPTATGPIQLIMAFFLSSSTSNSESNSASSSPRLGERFVDDIDAIGSQTAKSQLESQEDSSTTFPDPDQTGRSSQDLRFSGAQSDVYTTITTPDSKAFTFREVVSRVLEPESSSSSSSDLWSDGSSESGDSSFVDSERDDATTRTRATMGETVQSATAVASTPLSPPIIPTASSSTITRLHLPEEKATPLLFARPTQAEERTPHRRRSSGETKPRKRRRASMYRYQERGFSRDFLLIVALCVGLACAFIVVGRDIVMSLFEPAGSLDLD